MHMSNTADNEKKCKRGSNSEPSAQHQKPSVSVKYAYIHCAADHKPTTFSTTCCSQSWLIAGTPSAQRESKCQAIVFTTASQMGEWLRRNSDSLEGSKPPLLSSLPASSPAFSSSSPKRSLCRKQANQCRLANPPRPCACWPCCAESAACNSLSLCPSWHTALPVLK